VAAMMTTTPAEWCSRRKGWEQGGEGGDQLAGASGAGGSPEGGAGGECAGGSCVSAVCGNNGVEAGEDCDGGNAEDLDGCNSQCQSEVSSGPGLALAITDDGYTGTLASMACVNLVVASKGDRTLSTFIGQTAAGTWRLCAGDGLTGDTGSIDFVRLSVVQ
jgi:cysteine-rich repeat protein